MPKVDDLKKFGFNLLVKLADAGLEYLIDNLEKLDFGSLNAIVTIVVKPLLSELHKRVH